MSVEPFDILEDVHRMKSLAIEKGYTLSSLILLVDESARAIIRKHPDYNELCTGGQILGLDWRLCVNGYPNFIPEPYYDVVVRLGAAQHILRDDLLILSTT